MIYTARFAGIASSSSSSNDADVSSPTCYKTCSSKCATMEAFGNTKNVYKSKIKTWTNNKDNNEKASPYISALYIYTFYYFTITITMIVYRWFVTKYTSSSHFTASIFAMQYLRRAFAIFHSLLFLYNKEWVALLFANSVWFMMSKYPARRSAWPEVLTRKQHLITRHHFRRHRI